MLDFSQIPDGPSIPEGYVDMIYGTAGFRGSAYDPPRNMDHVAYRCGLLFAAIPFISEVFFVKYGNFVNADRSVGLGVVVTASHNPYYDNGIKLFSPTGSILDPFWEPFLTAFVNTRKTVQSELSDIFKKFKYVPRDVSLNILIGWDTRPSCDTLVAHLHSGITALYKLLNLKGSKVTPVGIITTPSISYLLSSRNIEVDNDETYLSFLGDSFWKVSKIFQELGMLDASQGSQDVEELYFDCGYGVACYKITRFFDHLRSLGLSPVLLNKHKSGEDEKLNRKSGAAYLLQTSQLPESQKNDFENYKNKRFCCFDGDCDRILYFLPNDPVMTDKKEYKVLLLHGDHLLIVTMMLLWTLMKNVRRKYRVGVFQTKYANSSSVMFIKTLMAKYEVENPNVTWQHEYFKTGLKNAEKLAEKYDVSVYYETNGHGNIIYNQTPLLSNGTHSLNGDEHLATKTANPANLDPPTNHHCGLELDSHKDDAAEANLLAFLRVFFPGGDAILNCLMLELAFRVLKLTLDDCLSFYQDFPSEHRKYSLPEELKQLFASAPDDDSLLLEPPGFQARIDAKVREFPFCRAFLRPSGTEPLLRIFVEAEDERTVDEVHKYIVGMVEEFLQEHAKA